MYTNLCSEKLTLDLSSNGNGQLKNQGELLVKVVTTFFAYG